MKLSYPDDFGLFWSKYLVDPMMSKKKAFEQWKKLSEEDRKAAFASLPSFIEYCRKNPWYRPVHACRYLSERRWEGFAAVTLDPETIEANKDRADKLMRRGKYAENYQ